MHGMVRVETTVVLILSLQKSFLLRCCRCQWGWSRQSQSRATHGRESLRLTNRILPTRLLRSEDLSRDSNLHWQCRLHPCAAVQRAVTYVVASRKGRILSTCGRYHSV
jgi:hypothetical protein